MNIGIVQLNTTVADVKGNMLKARNAIERCKKDGAELIVLTELFTTGYPPRDLIYRKDLISANLDAVQQFIAWSDELKTTITFGFVEPNGTDGQKDHFNSVMTVSKGQIVNLRRKTLLPTYDVFNEDRYFQAGDTAKEFVPFELDGVKVGVINCEEAWNDPKFWGNRLYSVNPVAEMVNNGASIIVIVNASPYRQDVHETRLKMMAAHCEANNVACVYVNQVGYNDDVGFDGRSFAMNRAGDVTYLSPAFREDVAVIDTHASPIPEKLLHMEWQHEVILALQTGVRDYFSKLGIKGPAIIGLSGGIDSALVAYIAATAIGPDRVIGVGMPSQFSSDHSRNDAAQIAKKLGVHFAMEAIAAPHSEVRTAINHINTQLYAPTGGTLFDRTFVNVEDSGVTDENFQARLRGLYLMGLSNYYNGIVLTTGNKSEMSVGYCTLYGDMAGGLAVISDLLKTKVFDICRWINESTRDEIIPWNTINKPPSAELRPGQTDQQSLPPYPILDEIVVKFVEEAMSPTEIIKDMAGYDRSMQYNRETGRNLEDDVLWVCQTTVRNEHKRKQAPTGLKLTRKMFKFGWEHPIVHKLPVDGVVKQGVGPTFPLGGEKLA